MSVTGNPTPVVPVQPPVAQPEPQVVDTKPVIQPNVIMSGLANYRTTIIGVLLAVFMYWQNVGLQLPDSREAWFQFVVSTFLAALGVVAKDTTTGSQPPPAKS